MFRRRPIRPLGRPVRPLVRPLVRPVVVAAPGAGAGNVPPALRRANDLMASGQYAEAAEIFDQFARGAEMRNGPRAPHFFLQAGRCRILAGQVAAGMTALMHGLALLAKRGETQHLHAAGKRAVEELRQHNLLKEADAVEALLAHNLPAGFTPATPGTPGATTAAPVQPKRLPTKCPSCGGSLIAEEVTWLDDATAECPYCGSGVRAE